jgi:hypothetical protein
VHFKTSSHQDADGKNSQKLSQCTVFKFEILKDIHRRFAEVVFKAFPLKNITIPDPKVP